MKTKWSNEKIPKCKVGKNHKWKGSSETGICLKCGYDVLDECYKEIEQESQDAQELNEHYGVTE